MSQFNPFVSPQNPSGGSISGASSGGPTKYTSGTAEILLQTRGWTIFRAVAWYIAGALMLVVALAAAQNFAAFTSLVGGGTVAMVMLLTALLLGEAVMLTIFAIRVGQYRQASTPGNMLNIVRSLKYFWLFNGIFAVVMALETVIEFLRRLL